MIFKSQAEKDFKIDVIESPVMEAITQKCANIYQGTPPWVDAKDGIKTINFSKSVCSETARLATLAIGIRVDGSARAEWLQKKIDTMYSQIHMGRVWMRLRYCVY